MENPYKSPPKDPTIYSKYAWLQRVFAVVAAVMSVLLLCGVVSNCVTFARLSSWPTSIWRWTGIAGMMFVMMMASFAFALIAVGLYQSTVATWQRGIWLLVSSVIGYALLVAVAVRFI
ncbi:MAG: hypothetical protein AAF483_11545 [Planctomycetota bacterium]